MKIAGQFLVNSSSWKYLLRKWFHSVVEHSLNMAATNAEIEKMSFREKQKYFEKEIKDAPVTRPPAKQFSYLSEHEVAMLRQEEARKVGGMSQAEILSYVAGGTGDITPDHDLDQVLSSLDSKRGGAPRPSSDSLNAREMEAEKRASWRRARMKSLEADAVQAQAVIAKAQEMSSNKPNPSRLQTVDIAFADDNHPNHNGDSRVEGVRQQMHGMKMGESQH